LVRFFQSSPANAASPFLVDAKNIYLRVFNLTMMKKISSTLLILALYLASIMPLSAQTQKTYCNPINLDYGYTPIPNFSEAGRHRATADPVIVKYKDDYYLFSTNQWGYWWSSDLINWNFISKRFLRPWNQVYDELCAPAVGIVGDTMLVFGSTYTSNFTLWMSTNPKGNNWKPLVDSLEIRHFLPMRMVNSICTTEAATVILFMELN
jgi:xylan 1,4-beta-xylosidase